MTVPNAGKRLLETDVMFFTSLLDLLLNSNDNGDLSSVVPNGAVEALPPLNSRGNGDLASEVVADILVSFFFSLLQAWLPLLSFILSFVFFILI